MSLLLVNPTKKSKMSNTSHKHETYEEFVDKYKTKKTSDDVMTPPDVMDVVNRYVAKTYNLDPSQFVRPFYPGGDFEAYPYEEGDVVVDNPPFSLTKRIVTFYESNRVPFFIFVQGRTITKYYEELTQIHTGRHIRYDNGAVIDTGFLTNLERHAIIGVHELGEEIARQPSQSRPSPTKRKKVRDSDELSGSDLETIARVMSFRIDDYRLGPGHSIGKSVYTPDALNLKEQVKQVKQVKLREAAERWQI